MTTYYGPISLGSIRKLGSSIEFDLIANEPISNYDLKLSFEGSAVSDSQNAIAISESNGSLATVGVRSSEDEYLIAAFSTSPTLTVPVGATLVSVSVSMNASYRQNFNVILSGIYNDSVEVGELTLPLRAESSTVNGVVLDGYVTNALIYLDANGNGIAEDSENTGLTTDAQGRFSGTVSGEGALIAVGGTNTDTGLVNSLILAAPSGSLVISPLTTLVNEIVKANPLSVADANFAVSKVLGLPSNLNLLQFDPLASPQDSASIAVQKANVQIATAISITGTELVESLASEVVSLSSSSTTLDLSNAATLTMLSPEASPSMIQSVSEANAAIKAAEGILQIAQSQKSALIASGRAGSDADDTMIGNSGDDVLSAGGGNDRIQGGIGSDKLDGGDGLDTAVFEKAGLAYRVEQIVDGTTIFWRVTDLVSGDADELRNIEFVDFDDKILNLDSMAEVFKLSSTLLSLPGVNIAVGKHSPIFQGYDPDWTKMTAGSLEQFNVNGRGNGDNIIRAVNVMTIIDDPADGRQIDPTRLGFWIEQIEEGTIAKGDAIMNNILSGFVYGKEFSDLALKRMDTDGDGTNDISYTKAAVQTMYRNVLGRSWADIVNDPGANWLAGEIEANRQTIVDVAERICLGAEAINSAVAIVGQQDLSFIAFGDGFGV